MVLGVKGPKTKSRRNYNYKDIKSKRGFKRTEKNTRDWREREQKNGVGPYRR